MTEWGAEVFGSERPEVESEFTGIKGALLRYAGCTYVLVLASQFLDALAHAWWCPAPAVDVLMGASAMLFPVAFVAYPLVVAAGRLLRGAAGR